MPSPKRILLVAATTGYQTRAFAEAGERLGYQIQLATDRCHVLDDPWGDHAIPLRFERPDSAAAVIAKFAAKSGAFDGIVAVGDRPTHLAALAARRLGLPYNSPDSVLACRNKYLARERFRQAGLPVPWFRRIALGQDPNAAAHNVEYPCVLKPLGLSASRGVIRADSPTEFAAAFKRVRRILASPDIVRMHEDQDRFLQVEDYIGGEEYAVEALLTHGQLTAIALFDKPDPLTGPFFEESIYTTPSRAPARVQREIIERVRRAAAALGLSHGPVHAEARVNQQGVWMLEVAARPIGGLCAQVLKFESGWGLEEIVLRHAAGDSLGSLEFKTPGRGVMMIPIPRGGIYTSVSGIDEARAISAIEQIVITAKEGQKLVPLPEGASYLGFIFAGAATAGEVEQALRRAHACLNFEILESLPVI
jgi:formate-dependent phosphoribosylglycinamide formyltransferase (GAR transformylase)